MQLSRCSTGSHESETAFALHIVAGKIAFVRPSWWAVAPLDCTAYLEFHQLASNIWFVWIRLLGDRYSKYSLTLSIFDLMSSAILLQRFQHHFFITAMWFL
jgi:hypothetical protein